MRMPRRHGGVFCSGARRAVACLAVAVGVLVLALCAAGSAGAAAPTSSATVQFSLTVAPCDQPPPDNNGCDGDFWLCPLLLVYSEGTPGTQATAGMTLYSLSNKTLTFTNSVIAPILDGWPSNLSCAPWSSVTPAATTLNPYASCALTLKYTIPTSLSSIPFFFGRVNVAAKDSTGAAAGSLQRFIVIYNNKVTCGCSKLDCQSFTCGSNHGCANVSVSCVNSGTQYLTPAATGCLRDPKGVQPTVSIPVTGAPVQILPQGLLTVTGSQALSAVKDGDYQLEVDCDYGAGTLAMTAPAHVATVSGTKTIALTGSVNSVRTCH